MQKRKLGRTGLEVSVLGYGAGAVGGLFTKGAGGRPGAGRRARDRGRHQLFRHRGALWRRRVGEESGPRAEGPEGRRRGRHQVPPDRRRSRRCRRAHRALDRGEPEAHGPRPCRPAAAPQSADGQGWRRQSRRRDRAERGGAGAGEAPQAGQDALHRLQRRGRARRAPQGRRSRSSSTRCRSSTTRSTPAPADRCPRARPASTMAACSTAPRPPTWARSSSARWRAARSPARPTAIRWRSSRSRRSARPRTSRATWRAPSSWSRW